MDRLTRPNMDLTFDTRKSASSASRSFSSKSATSKSFLFKQKGLAKEYRAKNFAGSKSAWMGDFKFAARQANTRGKYEVPNATRQANTKTMEVADARESTKGMPAREFAKSHRPYMGREADKMKKGYAPGEQPEGWSGELSVMTIDDVRELLNKNK